MKLRFNPVFIKTVVVIFFIIFTISTFIFSEKILIFFFNPVDKDSNTFIIVPASILNFFLHIAIMICVGMWDQNTVTFRSYVYGLMLGTFQGIFNFVFIKNPEIKRIQNIQEIEHAQNVHEMNEQSDIFDIEDYMTKKPSRKKRKTKNVNQKQMEKQPVKKYDNLRINKIIE